MKLRNLKIGTQLRLDLGAILLLVVALGVLAWIQTDRLWSNSKDLYDHSLTVRRAVGELTAQVLIMQRDMRDLCLTETAPERETLLQDLAARKANAHRQFTILYDGYPGPRRDIEEAEQAFVQWQTIRDETCRLLLEGKTAEASSRSRQTGPGGAQVAKILGELEQASDFARNKGDQFHAAATAQNKAITRQLAGLVIFILLLSVIVAWLDLKGIKSERSLLISLEEMRAENAARQRAEAAAQREQVLSNTLIDSIPGTFYLLDEHGRYVRWNAYQREVILGKAEEQIAGMSASDTIHPEDRALIQARIANVLGDGKDEMVEGRVLLRGGPAFIWMLMTGRRMTIAGQPFLVGAGIDITERKQTEAALHESAQMIEGIINAMPVRVFWKDKNLSYLGCNTAFARDAGFADPKDMVGKDDFQMGWREQAEAYRGDDRAVIESGRAKLLIEESRTTPTGDTITLLTSKLPLHNANGEITGLLGTYMDITDRKRTELELQRRAEDLRVRNAALTRFNAVTVGRELRMIELKREVNELCGKLNKPPRYKIVGEPPVSTAIPQDQA